MSEAIEVIEVLEDNSLIFPCSGCGSNHRVEVQPHKKTGWKWNGCKINPTITPSILAYASINSDGSKKTLCHLFVTKGNLVFCSDSPHDKAGKTVPMEAIK